MPCITKEEYHSKTVSMLCTCIVREGCTYIAFTMPCIVKEGYPHIASCLDLVLTHWNAVASICLSIILKLSQYLDASICVIFNNYIHYIETYVHKKMICVK